MAVKLYVGGLSCSTTSETRRQPFARCGSVEAVTVITDRDRGHSRGFGFVEVSGAGEAQTAIRQLNGPSLDGRAITVQIAHCPGGGGRGAGAPRRSPRW
jgi:RNA recognition motif-containing protein